MNAKENNTTFSRKQFLKQAGGAALTGGFMAGTGFPLAASAKGRAVLENNKGQKPAAVQAARVAADPNNIPKPITRAASKTHHIELESKEVVAEIEPGVQFRFMTFGGQVPAPFIRVRQGDTIILTLKSAPTNQMLHNVDFHAAYGTGGGAAATYVAPGQTKVIKFKTMYPGAFIYHCAVPRLDYHISSGMYGMIFVEPKEGLPKVDHEFYLGQNEVYTQQAAGKQGLHEFNFSSMYDEIPTYVLLNGGKHALTKEQYGPMHVKKGETARIFFVNGGPNLLSSFHPIGNVWSKAWRDGAIAGSPSRYLQTCPVTPGSCGIFEMEFPVPETVHLVDHALSRFTHKGMLGEIEVEGTPETDIYDPNYKQ